MGTNGASGFGRVAPVVLALIAACDLGSRFIPLDRFAFRAWEAVTLTRADEGPFGASRRVHLMHSSGDLASSGGLPRFREFREELFTTDASGFRVVPGSEGRVPVVLVVGDSFAAGCGSSDSQTVPSRLSAYLDAGVYSLAGPQRATPGDILAAHDRLQMQRGVVLYLALTSQQPPSPVPATWRTWTRPEGQEQVWLAKLDQFSNSRLSILAGRWIRPALDAVAASPPVGDIRIEQLRNGDAVLVRSSMAELLRKPRAWPTNGFESLSKQLGDAGMTLVVGLVPEKEEVYLPLGAAPENVPGHPAEVAALQDAGVQVVDLGPALAEAAREALSRHELVYWRDDTHWNPAAMDEAARLLAPAVAAALPAQ